MKTHLLFTFFYFTNVSIFAQTHVPVVFTIDDFDTHKEILGANVSIKEAGYATKTADSKGKVTFDNIPVGEIEYNISKDGYQFTTGRVNVSSELKSNTFRVSILKIPSPGDNKILVTGEVTDAESRDVEKALVEVKIADVVRTVATDESGNYSADIVPNPKFPSSQIRIEVKKDDCKKTETVELPRSNVVYRDIKLDCNSIGSTDGKSNENDSKKKNNDVDSRDEVLSVQNINNYKFEIIRCNKQGNTLTCEFAVTSLYKNRTLRMFLGGNYTANTTLYDDKGNQYFSTSGTLGNAGVPGYIDRYLIADIRTLGTVTFNNIATNATRIAALYFSIGGDDLSTNWVEFKDIKF